MDDGQASAAGVAALTIVESLLIALEEKGLLSRAEVEEILRAAMGAHEAAAEEMPSPERHRQVAALIGRVLAGGNGVRL